MRDVVAAKGNPATGSVEFKRFANSKSNTYGTARNAGKGDAIAAPPTTVNIAERQLIFNQLAVNNGLSLDVTINDPVAGAARTVNCYVGDRSIKLAALKNGQPTHWRDLKLSFIEN